MNTVSASLVEIIQRHTKPMEPIPTGEQACLKKLWGICAVVFDVYGTLLLSSSGDIGQSESNNHHVLDEVLFQIGYDVSKEDLFEHYKGIVASHQAHARERGITHPEVDICAVWKDFLNDLEIRGLEEQQIESLVVLYECLSNPVWLLPAVKKTLAILHRKCFQLAIISNAQFYTPLILETLFREPLTAYGLRDEACVWSYKHGEAKPSRKLFEMSARYLLRANNIQASEILYVGNDVMNDIEPAQALGFKTALFAGDRRSFRSHSKDPFLKKIKPDLVLTNILQLVDCIS